MKSRRSDAHEILRDSPEVAAAHRAEEKVRELSQLRERMRTLPNVRQELVSAIREEIREKRYRSDSRRIARALVAESALLRRALPMALDEGKGGLSRAEALIEIFEAQAELFDSLHTLVMRQRQALLDGSQALSDELDAVGRVLSERFRALDRERAALEESLDEPLDARGQAARRRAAASLQALLDASTTARGGHDSIDRGDAF